MGKDEQKLAAKQDGNPASKPPDNSSRDPKASQPADQATNSAKAVDSQKVTKSPDAKTSPQTQSKNPEPAQTHRRRWIFVVPIIVVIGLGLLGGFLLIQRDPYETQLELMGNIDVRQVNLAFKVEGRIDTLAVDEGSEVKAGDVIGSLDKRYFNDEIRIIRARRDNLAANVAKLEHGSRPEEIDQARALTADREAALIRAKEDYHRAEALVNKGGVSRQEFDRYQSVLHSAEAQQRASKESQRLVEIGPRQEDIDIARASLAEQDAMIAQTERRLVDADLIAPNDGTILTRARERGAIVQPGEIVFALTLTSPVWVRTYVNERDLGLISPDLPVKVITDSAPDRPYSGKIGFISPTAEFTPKTVETRELRTDLVYRIRIVVDNPDGGLRQGMPVTVRVQLPHPRKKTFWERMRVSMRTSVGQKKTEQL